MSIPENFNQVNGRIAEACRASGQSVDSVCLVAVSKRQPMERLFAAYEAGHRDFGENYVQELERKQAEMPDDARWHMIGHLQTNKAKRAVGAAWVHTVDSKRVARALSRAAVGRAEPLRTMVEVNIAKEETKSGVAPEACEALVEAIRHLEGIVIAGLMSIPPPGAGSRWFIELRQLRDNLARATGLPLTELSMGMSDDYEAAVREGATLVRVGTALFGPRQT